MEREIEVGDIVICVENENPSIFTKNQIAVVLNIDEIKGIFQICFLLGVVNKRLEPSTFRILDNYSCWVDLKNIKKIKFQGEITWKMK
jgi:hypothetical protein